MKLFEIFDDGELRLMMSTLLQKAGYLPYFAEHRFKGQAETVIRVPVNGESYVRLAVKDDLWSAALIMGRSMMVTAKGIDLEAGEIIPWIEKLGYRK